jgi:hypothetical protein
MPHKGRWRNRLQGTGEDVSSGPVVTGEPDDVGFRVVGLKAEEESDVSATKAVDRLIWIADRAEVAIWRRQLSEQPILPFVDVLILVDRDPLVPPAVGRGELLVRLESSKPISPSSSTWKSGGSPARSCCSRRIRKPREWKVVTVILATQSGSNARMRSRISSAALRVKVIARQTSGRTPRAVTRCAMR